MFDDMMETLVRNQNQDTLEEFAKENLNADGAVFEAVREWCSLHRIMLYIRQGSRPGTPIRVELRSRKRKVFASNELFGAAVAEAVVMAVKEDLMNDPEEPGDDEEAEEKPKKKRGRRKKAEAEAEEAPEVDEAPVEDEDEE